jgi:hypothetical protein
MNESNEGMCSLVSSEGDICCRTSLRAWVNGGDERAPCSAVEVRSTMAGEYEPLEVENSLIES